MTKLMVGYGAMSIDFSAPGDRRRFAGFADRAHLDIKAIEHRPRGNDLVVMTLGSDISRWRSLKRDNGALVLDLVDAYLDEPQWSFRRLFRGTYKSLTGQLRIPTLRYTDLLRTVVSEADAVTCASIEQRNRLIDLNPNVIATVDCLEELFGADTPTKAIGPSLRLLWEGFPENLHHFEDVLHHLTEMSKHFALTLEVLTDLSGVRRGSSAHVRRFLRTVERPNLSVVLEQWSTERLRTAVNRCDFGIIPIKQEDSMAWRKSENKLLSFWAVGLPCFVSPTPSYKRLIDEIPGQRLLSSPDEWTEVLKHFVDEPEALGDYRHSIVGYSRERCGSSATDSNWWRLVHLLHRENRGIS